MSLFATGLGPFRGQQSQQKPKKSGVEKISEASDTAIDALKDQQAQTKVAFDIADKRLKNLQGVVELQAQALSIGDAAESANLSRRIQEAELLQVESDMDLNRVKSEAQKVMIGQEMETLTGIPADDFIGPQEPSRGGLDEGIQSLIGLGITPTSQAIESQDLPGLLELARSQPQGNVLSDIVDVLGFVTGPLGISDTPGLDLFGTDPGFDEIARRLGIVQQISTAGAAPGVGLAASVAPAAIGAQVDLTQIIAGIEQSRIGLESTRIGTEAELTAQRALLDLETQVDLERIDVDRARIGVQRELGQQEIDLREETIQQREGEFVRNQALKLRELTQGDRALDLRELDILSSGQNMPASLLMRNDSIATKETAFLLELRQNHKASAILIEAITPVVSAEGRVVPRTPEQIDQLLQEAVAQDPGQTVESLQESIRAVIDEQVGMAVQSANNLLGIDSIETTAARSRVVSSLARAAGRLGELAESEEAIQRVEQATPFVDDAAVRKRIREEFLSPPGPPGGLADRLFRGIVGRPVIRDPQTGRERLAGLPVGQARTDMARVLQVREALRGLAGQLGLSGPLYDDATQKKIEQQVLSPRAGELRKRDAFILDNVFLVIQSHFQKIQTSMHAPDLRLKEIASKDFGADLKRAGLGDNIFLR